MALSNHHPSQETKLQFSSGEAASLDRFLAMVMQESADIFGMLTPLCEMLNVSPGWQTFTGQEEHACRGRGWLETFHPLAQPQIEEALTQVASGRGSEWTCQTRRYDASYRLMHWRLIPLCEPSGALFAVVVCGRDITKREQAGQMSEAEVELAIEASGVGAWDRDLATNQIQMTDQGKALFGLSFDEQLTYERFLSLLHPDDRQRVKALIAYALAERTDYRTEYRAIWPDGSIHWLAARGRGRSDGQGQPTHMIGTVIDITDQKQAEQSIATILTSITDAFLHLDTRWRYTYLNQRAEKIAKKNQEELLGRSLWETFPELSGTVFEQKLREAMATQQTVAFETLHPWEQGWFEIHAYPAPDGLSLYLHDITERKQVEERLQESERQFRRLVDSNIIGIVLIDLEGHIHEANDAFLSLVGYTREDLAAGQISLATITPLEYQAQDAQATEEVEKSGAVQPYEKEYVAKDGTHVPVLTGATLLRRVGSSPLAITFIVDLSARREMEQQKDLMLGMTSHELKMPLAAIKGTIQLAQRRLKRTVTTADHLSPEIDAFFEGLTKNLADVVRQIDVQTHLINDLLDASRITARTLTLDLQCCDLVPIVRDTVEDLRVIAPERALLLDMPEHTTVEVLADRARISQVVTNYVTNALRYSLHSQPVQIGLALQEGCARIWVKDRGPGLSAEEQNDLWQRFHQIKGVPVLNGSGKGLGLGLYICQMLIAQHQGKVGVESMPGEGSTFWFTLPLVT
jgi:PAS domain S-box-containing protein